MRHELIYGLGLSVLMAGSASAAQAIGYALSQDASFSGKHAFFNALDYKASDIADNRYVTSPSVNGTGVNSDFGVVDFFTPLTISDASLIVGVTDASHQVRDIAFQVSNDPTFTTGVTTVGTFTDVMGAVPSNTTTPIPLLFTTPTSGRYLKVISSRNYGGASFGSQFQYLTFQTSSAAPTIAAVPSLGTTIPTNPVLTYVPSANTSFAGFPVTRLNDGDLSGANVHAFNNGTGSSTDATLYYQLSLTGGPTFVKSLAIWNSSRSPDKANDVFAVLASSDGGVTYTPLGLFDVGPGAATSNPTQLITFSSLVFADVLRIIPITPPTGGSMVFTEIAEVRVFGYVPEPSAVLGMALIGATLARRRRRQ